jgi:thiamine-monophosphate kinase
LYLHDKVSKIKGVHVIGHITKESHGLMLETRDGTEVEIKAQGWDSIG